jgi:hypothetical protein
VNGMRRAAAAIENLFVSYVDLHADRRGRVWTERVLACLSAVVAVTTLFWRDWIELVFRIDPDRGSGALEWAIVAGCLAASVAFTSLARRDASASRGRVADA